MVGYCRRHSLLGYEGIIMASFEKAINKTLEYEDRNYLTNPKYSIDVNGYGVKFGINAKHNPGVDVKNLTVAQAKEIYKKKYWKPGFDNIPDQTFANQLFDWYVTSESHAIRALQTLINLQGIKTSVDGILGSGTLKILSSMDYTHALEKYVSLRKKFYARLHEKNPKVYSKNVYASWIDRTERNYLNA